MGQHNLCGEQRTLLTTNLRMMIIMIDAQTNYDTNYYLADDDHDDDAQTNYDTNYLLFYDTKPKEQNKSCYIPALLYDVPQRCYI